MTADENLSPEPAEEPRPSLSAAARRDLLAELAGRIGETAVIEGDKLIVETGDPVALYIRVESSGSYGMTWWMTSTSPLGHPRWREAAETILTGGESIHTSALGGGFLVEIERQAASEAEVLRLIEDRSLAERVHAISEAFPVALAELPEEDVPDYLLAEQETS